MRNDDSMKVINFGTRKIKYNLHRGNRQRLRIVVAPELTVDVFAPVSANEEQIQAAMMKKAAWIASKLGALEKYHPLPAPKRQRSGSMSLVSVASELHNGAGDTHSSSFRYYLQATQCVAHCRPGFARFHV